MSAQLRILKDGQFEVIELGQKGEYYLSKSIASLTRFDTLNNTFSYTIKVPSTKRNNLLLEFALLSTSSTVMKGAQVRGQIINGADVIEGYVRVMAYVDREHIYEVLFIGDNYNWYKQIDKPLNELPIAYGGQEIIFKNNATFFERCFAPYGLGTDDIDGWQSGDFPLWASLKNFGQWSDNYAKHTEMRYDIYNRYLLEEIFKDFTVVSKFFDSEKFRKSISYLPLKFDGLVPEDIMFVAQQQDYNHGPRSYAYTHPIYGFISGDTSPYMTLENPIIISDPNKSSYLTDHWLIDVEVNAPNPTRTAYKVPFTGKYKVKTSYTITLRDPLNGIAGLDPAIYEQIVSWAVRVEENLGPSGVYYANKTPVHRYNSHNIAVGTTYSFNEEFVTEELSAGWWLEPIVIVQVAAQRATHEFEQSFAGWVNGVNFDLFVQHEITFLDAFKYDDNIQMYCRKLLDKSKRTSDIIKGWTQAFNLQWMYRDGKIYVEPYSQFYKPTTDAIDLNGKIDCRARKEYSLDGLKRYQTFKFKDDSNDFYSKGAYKKKYDLGARFADGEDVNENTFYADTVNFIDSGLQGNTGGFSVNIPRIWKEKDGANKNYDVEPRLLYKLGFKGYPSEDWCWELPTPLGRIPKALQVGEGAHLGFSDSLGEDYYDQNMNELRAGEFWQVNGYIGFNEFSSFDWRYPISLNVNGETIFARVNSIEKFNVGNPVSATVKLFTLL